MNEQNYIRLAEMNLEAMIRTLERAGCKVEVVDTNRYEVAVSAKAREIRVIHKERNS